MLACEFVHVLHLQLSLTDLYQVKLVTFFPELLLSLYAFLFYLICLLTKKKRLRRMWLIFVTTPHLLSCARGGADLNPTENIVGHATKLIRLRPQSTRRGAGNRDCRNRRSLIKDPHRTCISLRFYTSHFHPSAPLS